MVTTNLTWEREWRFKAENPIGNSVIIDGPFTPGATYESLKPGQMMLASLAACLGMDFVKDMANRGQALTGLSIETAGTMDPEPPNAYSRIDARFTVRGDGLDENTVREAIRRAELETCSVAATLRGGASISTSFEIRE